MYVIQGKRSKLIAESVLGTNQCRRQKISISNAFPMTAEPDTKLCSVFRCAQQY